MSIIRNCVNQGYCIASRGVYPSSLNISRGSIPCVQQVRWRKPRWVPKAPSKIFLVREPTPIDPEEYAMLSTLYNHYRTRVKSIRAFFRADYQARNLQAIEQATETEVEADDRILDEMRDAVRIWNEAVGKQREERLLHEDEARKAKLLVKIQKDDDDRLHRMDLAEKKFEQEKDESGSFIKVDDLDNEIEALLNSRVDYNFVIDLDGNKTYKDGRKPPDTPLFSEERSM